MLETGVGYEQRRRNRAQIRLVKKHIQEEEKSKDVKKTTNTNRTEVIADSYPTRKTSPLRKLKNGDVSEYTSKYSKAASKVDRTTSPVQKSSPNRKQTGNDEYVSSERTTTTKKQVSLVI